MRHAAATQAVARVVLRDASRLPAVLVEDEAAMLNVMDRERDRLKSQKDRLCNQLHNHLFEVDPQYRKTFPSLSKDGPRVGALHPNGRHSFEFGSWGSGPARGRSVAAHYGTGTTGHPGNRIAERDTVRRSD